MTNILNPSKTRRILSEVAGVRRYHRNPARAASAARGGVLWVPVSKGWAVGRYRQSTFNTLILNTKRT